MKRWPKDEDTYARVRRMTDRFREGVRGPSSPGTEKPKESWESFIARMNRPVTLSPELSHFLGLTGEQE